MADHDATYPKTLAELPTGFYLPEIPTCPAAGKDTYSAAYRVVRDENDNLGFSVYCQGHHHPQLQADKPFFASSEGLVMGPVAEITQGRPSPPAKGEKQTYQVDDGPQATLDAADNVLRLAYGPKAQSLLQAPGREWSAKPSIAEALRWGDSRVVYLDYLDLEPMWATLEASLQQAADQGDDEAIFLKAFARRLRPRMGPLQGVSCLKVTDQGLHYRSKGVASTGVFAVGAVFGVGFYLPSNTGRSRAQGQLIHCTSNLKNVATGLEMWASDNEGRYPDSLGQLIPDYLRTIPECPAAGTDTYSETYSKSRRDGVDFEVYEVFCKGLHHLSAGIPEDYPRYNGFEGLVERP
jgi:hypothetical protein